MTHHVSAFHICDAPPQGSFPRIKSMDKLKRYFIVNSTLGNKSFDPVHDISFVMVDQKKTIYAYF